jgi:poly(hydroxyalkanoate) depolymerase family esterase
MRVLLVGLAMLAGMVTATAPASAATVEEITGFGTNPGGLRMFRYVPDGLPTGRPVVVALHGCLQDAPGYGTDSGWAALADEWGFTLVLPQQQVVNNPGRCFNWFSAVDTARGAGEAESVVQMVRASPGGPVFVTGLSAGGGMTSALLAAYPDVFAGGGVVAGVPDGCATTLLGAPACQIPGRDRTPVRWGDEVRASSPHTGPWPVVSVWHGTADVTVTSVNQREIAEQWTDVHGVAPVPSDTDTAAGHPRARYRDATGRVVVETVTVPGMGHGQPVDPAGCGRSAPFVLDVDVCAAREIGRFWGLP